MKKIFRILFVLTFCFCGNVFAQGTWVTKAMFPSTGRGGCASFSIGTKGYIGTGNDSSGFKKDFWEWDQTTNVWTQIADFGGGFRFYAVGFSLVGKAYVGTGYSAAT